MSEKSGFFNAKSVDGTYDRVYDAYDFADYFATFIGNGVFADPSNQLKVYASSGLNVSVKPGKAFIKGHYYILDEAKSITVPLNTSSVNKTYYVCCTLDNLLRTITTDVRETGTQSTPEVSEAKHELILCSIIVKPGETNITDSMITDRRPDPSYCGYVSGVVKQIDVQDAFTQFQAAFEEWFNNVKEVLSDDAEGHLLTLIETEQQRNDTQQNSINNLITRMSGVERENTTQTTDIGVLKEDLSSLITSYGKLSGKLRSLIKRRKYSSEKVTVKPGESTAKMFAFEKGADEVIMSYMVMDCPNGIVINVRDIATTEDKKRVTVNIECENVSDYLSEGKIDMDFYFISNDFLQIIS